MCTQKKINNVLLWGAGGLADLVFSSIDLMHNTVDGIIDINPDKWGNIWKYNIVVYSPEVLKTAIFDKLIITVYKYEDILEYCQRCGIDERKIVAFWEDKESERLFKNRSLLYLEKYKEVKILINRLESAPYEWGLKPVPQILSGEVLLRRIIREKKSLCRFGDGEFEIMRGNERAWFQKTSTSLKNRLIEVIRSKQTEALVAIAQNFYNLGQYKDEAADGIREYMSNGTRDAILGLLDMDRVYYDAYVSRPYIIYKKTDNANMLFPLFKEIWKNQDVVIVEGNLSRVGINNDLFDEANSIRRVECPIKDSWECYDRILHCIISNVDKGDLVCISLGPTATVLAYDLSMYGIWAIDIGQLDNEYDWYIRNTDIRIPIKGKMVAELSDHIVTDRNIDDIYESQIIECIENGSL